MRIVLVGAGLQAQAIASDIISNAPATGLGKLIIADFDKTLADALKARLLKTYGRKVDTLIDSVAADATKKTTIAKIAKGADCIIGCTSYKHNVGLSEVAIKVGASFCDLGGNVDVVKGQHKLSAQAKKAGSTIIPDCGVAPGMMTILAYYWAHTMDSVDNLNIRVGGLPVEPKTTLEYQRVFNIEGLFNEYVEDCEIIENGKRKTVRGMGEIESLSFGQAGRKKGALKNLEAFYTSGGTSTLPKTLHGKVKNLDYKTIRYPGHGKYMRLMMDMGFFSSEKISIGRAQVSPRQICAKLFTDYLPDSGDDLMVLRVDIEGKRDGKKVRERYDCVDYNDHKAGLSSMQRCTGFPVAIVAQMLAMGSVGKKGTVPQELAIDGKSFLVELKKRGIVFKKKRF